MPKLPSYRKQSIDLQSSATAIISANLVLVLGMTHNCTNTHCVKSVLIRSYSSPYLPTFGLNTEKCSGNTDQNKSKYGRFLRSE